MCEGVGVGFDENPGVTYLQRRFVASSLMGLLYFVVLSFRLWKVDLLSWSRGVELRCLYVEQFVAWAALRRLIAEADPSIWTAQLIT